MLGGEGGLAYMQCCCDHGGAALVWRVSCGRVLMEVASCTGCVDIPPPWLLRDWRDKHNMNEYSDTLNNGLYSYL